LNSAIYQALRDSLPFFRRWIGQCNLFIKAVDKAIWQRQLIGNSAEKQYSMTRLFQQLYGA
jgi:hypothetical protein